MADAPLIDAFCEDDCLDATVVRVSGLDPEIELVIVDANDPDHHGPVR